MALDFPSSPINGQVYDNFIYDSDKGTWKSLSSGASPNYLVGPTITNAVITATATTPSTVPVTINAAASQSANLQEWKNSAGIIQSRVNSSGSLHTPTLGVGALNPPVTGGEVVLQTYGRMRINADSTNSAGIWFSGAGGSDVAFFGGSSTTESDPLGIYHSGAWRMQIDSSGRMRVPYQPAFRAFNPSGASGAIISFAGNDTAFNGRNSGWNGSTRFTAPVSGVYVFTFSILTSGTITRILFRINGTSSTQYGDPLADGHGSYSNSSMSMAFRLSASDYVELLNEQGGVYGTPFGSFSGYFLG